MKIYWNIKHIRIYREKETPSQIPRQHFNLTNETSRYMSWNIRYLRKKKSRSTSNSSSVVTTTSTSGWRHASSYRDDTMAKKIRYNRYHLLLWLLYNIVADTTRRWARPCLHWRRLTELGHALATATTMALLFCQPMSDELLVNASSLPTHREEERCRERKSKGRENG